jgi:azurin
MRFRQLSVLVAVCIACAVAPLAARQRGAAAPVRTIVITVGDPAGEKMTYSLSQITAKPGERLRIRLLSTGKMPKIAMAHNWVLLARGSNAKAFADAAANARATDFIPPALRAQVLARTGLLGPGESEEVMVTVPKVPGAYPYLCTFAGHFAAGMAGTLTVK